MPRAEWLAAVALGLAGCASTPLPVRPSVPSAADYKYGAAWRTAQPGDHLPRGDWWSGFADPQLDELIAQVDSANPTLAAAVARFDRATASARLARSALFPSIEARASSSLERHPAGQSVERSALGAALGYELDLWGRVRNEVRAGESDAAAAAADTESVRLSLKAAVADNYLRLRGLDAQQALLDRTVAAYERADALIRTRHQGGIASGIDRSRSQTQLSNARARARAVAAQRAAVENLLAVLVGSTPSQFSIVVTDSIPRLPEVTPGLPSTLIERRFDVAAAERRLIAANARIGASRAALLPTLELGLTGGLQATSILSAPASYWALGPLAAVLNLFDGGRRRARVGLREAEYRELAELYRDTVLNAFREVEDALALSATLAEEEVHRRSAAQAAARTEALALDRYRDGASDYLQVVIAQTAALEAQQTLIDVVVDRRRAAVTLVRALGGGAEPAPTMGAKTGSVQSSAGTD